jgi:hypothetical protein
VLDGLLQLQSYMFTPAFAAHVLAPSAAGNPHWIAASILWASGIVAAAPVVANSVFAVVQLALGLGIAYRGTLRVALGASIAWSLVVWWFGEGLGGLLTAQATPLDGAPGAVLLYGMLAVILWPAASASDRPPTEPVAFRPLRAVPARIVWTVLWGGLALLALQPVALHPKAVSSMATAMATDQPPWLSVTLNGFGALTAGNGLTVGIVTAVVLGLVAATGWLPPALARVGVVVAVAASVIIWVAGQAVGDLFGGQATDPNSGPLLVLIALAYWPGREIERPEVPA